MSDAIASGKVEDGAFCRVVAGTHRGKSGIVRGVNVSKTGHQTITVVQPDGERFKTLGRNVVVEVVSGSGGSIEPASLRKPVDSLPQDSVRDPDGQAGIDRLAARFFASFDNRGGRIPTADALLGLFAERAVVARHQSGHVDLYTPAEFASPRIALLRGGELVDFHEWEDSSTTEILGSLALRTSRYSKSGAYRQAPYTGSGTKFFQLAASPSGWKIVALSWIDDA